ncbi:hypothetical protein BURKHO8Y_510009 [Burkholderia sp. 8Y]|nr:hypothetical protein BURKHO8Y_510009 [Burkholderia sp. 8Y]
MVSLARKMLRTFELSWDDDGHLDRLSSSPKECAMARRANLRYAIVPSEVNALRQVSDRDARSRQRR